jgi:hypothetical protein
MIKFAVFAVLVSSMPVIAQLQRKRLVWTVPVSVEWLR